MTEASTALMVTPSIISRAAGSNPVGNNRRDSTTRVVDVKEISEECDHKLRRPRQPNRHLSRDAKRAFASNKSPQKVVAWKIDSTASEPDHFTCGKHDFEAENVICSHVRT